MSTRPAKHKDVEYAVDDASGRERIFKTASEASAFAISLAMSHGNPVHIDVLVYSVKGAVWYRGPGGDGEEEYEEDPEASVFDRIIVKAEAIGRVA
jgi:hypothetical protein